MACTVAFNVAKGNSIDSLKNRQDVVEFFRQHFTKQFRESNFDFLFRKNEEIGDTSWLMQPDTSAIQKYFRRESLTMYRSDSFYKIDIDGNGKTDLVLDASVLIIVMDMESGPIMHYLDGSHRVYFYQNIITLPHGGKAILLRNQESEWTDTPFTIDTIVYQLKGLVEYNNHLEGSAISKITYYGYSVSSMPNDNSFCMEINKDGTSFFSGNFSHWNDLGRDGDYSFINKKEIADLLAFTEYADFRSKRENYSTGINHASGSDLTVYFDDGYVKKIHTWGAVGTIGLNSFHEMLFDLLKQPGWQAANYKKLCEGKK